MKKYFWIFGAICLFLIGMFNISWAEASNVQVTFQSVTWSVEGDKLHFDVVTANPEFPVICLYSLNPNNVRENVIIKGVPSSDGNIRFTDTGKNVHASQWCFNFCDANGQSSDLWSYVAPESESGIPYVGICRKFDEKSHAWRFMNPGEEKIRVME